jgi:rsbT co-antagonist protein RsbR
MNGFFSKVKSMSTENKSQLANVITTHHNELLAGWLDRMMLRMVRRDPAAQIEIKKQAMRFLPLLAKSIENDDTANIESEAWEETRQLLTEISQARARQGFTSIETAYFVFSLKTPLFAYLRASLSDDPQTLVEETTKTSSLFDDLGLFTIEIYQKSREQVIMSQQQELLELSTPVVQLWKDVLALPLIGTLDSARTQVVMENLLQKIADTGALIAIIDITGVPTVDTLVAQHLLKTIAAARLMGADCIISGIRPQIAQTIVHLGVDLTDVVTKATLADAFIVALKRTGSNITYSNNDD